MPAPLSEQLRHVIESCGKSRYQLSRETGIDQATLSRFISDKGGLSIQVLDQLGKVLGLKIIVAKRKDTNRSRKYGEHQ